MEKPKNTPNPQLQPVQQTIETDKEKTPIKPSLPEDVISQDHLLQCLIILTKIYQCPTSTASLTAGLPLEDGKLTPELFARAAKRAGLSARMAIQPLDEISNLSLPAVLLMKNGEAFILERIDDHGNAYLIQPESGTGMRTLPIERLALHYTGQIIFVRPEYRFERRTEEMTTTPKKKHWFWSVIQQMWPTYGEILFASFLINLFIIALPLFIMNVYDRVVPNNAIHTLWVLAIGVTIVFSFDFIMRMLRGYFVDNASKNIDTRLSASIFEQILGIRMADRPQSVGAMTNTVHAFESFRDFITSASITTLIDFPFILLFIAIIWVLGGPIVLIPLLLIPVIIGIGFFTANSFTRFDPRKFSLHD